jgi:hypothetical protein
MADTAIPPLGEWLVSAGALVRGDLVTQRLEASALPCGGAVLVLYRNGAVDARIKLGRDAALHLIQALGGAEALSPAEVAAHTARGAADLAAELARLWAAVAGLRAEAAASAANPLAPRG